MLVACISKLVYLFNVQARTLSSTFLSIGKLSPVSIDSSIDAFHKTIFQSTGILSHGLTKIISQTFIFSISTSIN
jgi:hypothetical protein